MANKYSDRQAAMDRRVEVSAEALASIQYDPFRALPGHEERCAARFAQAIAGAQKVAVAFSGGVDSSLVIALALRATSSEQVLAVLGVSPSLAGGERNQAHEVAELMGVRLIEVYTQEMNDPRYVTNDSQRCYFCKHELYSRSMADAVLAEGADLLVNGDTADDVLRTDRAGRRAALEFGVRSPLADAGIGKAEVRSIARSLGLPVWNKPSSPCLASRIPGAVPVTIGRLREVENAEAGLRALGLRELRVRHRGSIGLVQLGSEDHRRVQDHQLRAETERIVKEAGFKRVEFADEPLRRD